ncbi:hypothetical protein DAA48_16490 [Aeromonas veronii]|uniref:Uncharacterized protein n=1 Tax=Aeromonas veronii TaxID=654 RepID=A0A2T4N009_AERVE|nr:hypothetical protein DAA48_16490 [Aeromonas veronii]
MTRPQFLFLIHKKMLHQKFLMERLLFGIEYLIMLVLPGQKRCFMQKQGLEKCAKPYLVATFIAIHQKTARLQLLA